MPAYLPNLQSLDGLGGGYADAAHQRPRQATKGAVYRRQPPSVSGSMARGIPAMNSSSGSTRELQKFLVSRGYKITVDGIRGPQTRAAANAYSRGVAPSRARIPSIQPRRITSTRSATPRRTVAPVRRYTAPRIQPGSRTIGIRPPAAPNVTTPAVDTFGGDMTGGTDYAAQAEAMVGAQYDSQIAAIQRAMAAAQAQAEAQAAATLKGYGEVSQVATQAAGQTQAANAQLANVEQTANQGMVNLFGGPGANGPAGEAAAFAGINQGELAQLASAQQAYDQQMPAVIQTQGQNQAAALRAQAAAQIADMQGQLSDLQGQRAADVTQMTYKMQQDAADQAYQQQQDQLKYEQAQQSLDLARKLAGPKVQQARAQASLTTQKAQGYQAEVALKLKQFGLSRARTNAYIRNANIRTRIMQQKAKKTASGGIDLADPNTLGTLQDNLHNTIAAKNGNFAVHPGVAKRTLYGQLTALGLQKDPRARNLVGTIIQQTLDRSHALGQWKHIVYDPRTGGIVDRTPRRPRKRK